MTPDIIRVCVLSEYRIEAEFSTGEVRRIDMQPFLHYPAYAALTDPKLFETARADNGVVVWTDEIDLSADTVYLRGERCN
jgi:hypothetical protein